MKNELPSDIEPTITGAEFGPSEIVFQIDDETIMKITERGMEYKGQVIMDAGEAYHLMLDWLRREQANEQAQAHD